jgi:hypothetical protein
MMSMTTPDLKLYVRRKHTPPPSVLLLTHEVSNTDQHHCINHSVEFHSHRSNSRHPPSMIGLHVNNLDIHDTSSSSFGWQRHSDKIGQMIPAPDVAYRYTYMEEMKREKLDTNNGYHRSYSRSPSPRNQLSPRSKITTSSSSSRTSESSHQKYRTVYDYIRDSIRQIERQRNSRHQNISSRIKRPQNTDSTLQRVLGEKKTPVKSSLSRSNSTIMPQVMSSLFNNELKSPQSFVNYINYSRVFQSTTPNQLYPQQQSNDEHSRQQFLLSQN